MQLSHASGEFLKELLECTHFKNLYKGRELHAQIIKSPSHSCLFLANSLVNFYAKCGQLSTANLVFNKIANKDVVSWNCLIIGYSQQGHSGSSFVMDLFRRMIAENTYPDRYTFTGVFNAASNVSDISGGRQGHAVAIKTASFHNVFIGSSLLKMYCKTGLVDEARKVFDRMPERDLISWNTMISGYATQELAEEALELFQSMCRETEGGNEFAFTSVLSALTLPQFVDSGKQIHSLATKNGMLSITAVGNALVSMYCKTGSVGEARQVFDRMPERDSISWNTMISGYATQELAEEALELFESMCRLIEGVDEFVFPSVLSALTLPQFVDSGKQIHSLATKNGMLSISAVGTALVSMYCKTGSVGEARKVFDRMPERDSISWHTMISGYVMQELAEEALELFKSMHRETEGVNEFVFTKVLSALTLPQFVDTGKQIHSLATKKGMLSGTAMGYALVTMYAKCGNLDDAVSTFYMSGNRNSITWSAMINGYAQSGDSDKALKLFQNMHLSGVMPCEFTLVGVINACSDLFTIVEGKQMHSYSLKLGYESNMYILTALVDMYAKCGSIDDARKGFDYLQQPDIVLWTSIITGYAWNGDLEGALNLYCKMETEGVIANELIMESVLRACSSLATLDQGMQIHARIIKYGFGLEAPIGSVLSAMYTKCGNLDDGYLVFRKMPSRDVISWNLMISGLSQNCHGKEALQLFEEMCSEGIKPDPVTFLKLLSTCSHMGLVQRGWDYFKMMSDEFGIVPTVEHYSCMVDILSRAGKLNEAKEFIESAKIDHRLSLWRILLGACRNYHNYDLGAYAGEKLMELGATESSTYVLLWSIYAALGKWEDVDRVKRTMKAQGVSKEPGCSWIELKSLIHVFLVGDQMHPQIDEIRLELQLLTKLMKDEGYIDLVGNHYI